MLKKLIRYEFQATARIFLPLYGAFLAMSLLLRLVMTVQEAQNQVQSYVDSLENAWLNLSFNGDQDRIQFSERGFTWDNPQVVEEAAALGNTGNVLERYKEIRDVQNENVNLTVEYSWDEQSLRSYLNEQAQERNTEAVEATLTRVRGGFCGKSENKEEFCRRI